jgi:hypothetical protein
LLRVLGTDVLFELLLLEEQLLHHLAELVDLLVLLWVVSCGV